MGFFLRSRFVTHTLVFIGMLCASFATFIYAWQFSRDWPNPNNFAKVVKVFAMTTHGLFALQSLLTWHSLRVTSTSLSFGLWATFGLASLVFDAWWFALMSAQEGAGFSAVCGEVKDGSADCARRGVTIASCVYFGFYGLYRLFVLIVVFAFDAHFNETVLPTLASSTTAAPTAGTYTLPGMTFAPSPAAAAAQHPVTVARSLAKALRPRWEGRARYAELARWAPAGREWAKVREEEGKGEERRGVPLIAVSLHEERPHTHDEEEEEEGERGVLFDAHAAGAGAQRLPRDKGDESSDLTSSSDEEDEDDAAAQAAYERRRAARRAGKGKSADGEERGRYAAV
ncbi:hypothetical protein JCM10450v2_004084 [Rhodotorula kratochvilovae]